MSERNKVQTVNTASLERPVTSARIKKAVRNFTSTLWDFCETVLDNGTEQNGEWVVGDLRNTPGDSCWIDLSTGKFIDYATGERGGAIRLWPTLFNGGERMDMADIIEEMEAWNRDGTLPDGQGIGVRPEPTAIKKRKAPKHRHNAEAQAKWLDDVVEWTQSFSRTAAEIFAEKRGLSVEVFEWLIAGGYIGFYQSIKSTKDKRRTWTDCEWAFPVCDVTPTHVAFYGMHLKWFRNGNSSWRYEPRGIPALPLVIGDLPKADLVVIGESTWDVIAHIDLYDLHTWSEEDGRWAVIATRGAQNVKNAYPVFNQIKSTAHLKVLRQNDLPDFNFFEALPEPIRAKGRSIRSPDELGCKDLNGWMRVETPEAIKRRLKQGF
jgi:hypothetical protein